jgi:DNA invertase Pin-like site-specific DNA recombinase
MKLRSAAYAMYSQDISNKVKSAIETRNRRGDYWGGSPFYGYLTAPDDRKKLVVDGEARDVVQSIFDMCVDGLTTSEIAGRLNAQGIPTPLQHKKRRGGLYNGAVKEGGSLAPLHSPQYSVG